MNNLYVISKDDPIQLFDEAGPIEDGCDLTGIVDSLPLDLDNSDGKKRIEYRYHKRYQLTEDAFALIRSIHAGPLNIHGKSMGCIACAVFNAKPAKLGKIDNISRGGLMFYHADSKEQLSQALVLDILLADCGFYLANMPFKTITDVVISFGILNPAVWNWKRTTFVVLSLCALYIGTVVPEHYLHDHLWEHIIKHHLFRVFLWSFGALLFLHWGLKYWNLETFVEQHTLWVLAIGALLGIIPESGPHLIFVMMYAQGLVPFSVLFTTSFVQDGHGISRFYPTASKIQY